MRRLLPRQMTLLGFVLVMVGVIIPFLMVMRIIEASFFLSFLSYGASITGLLLGLMGVSWHIRGGRD